IIFAPAADEAIHRVPSIGGEPEPITELLDKENSHRHPRFLPNGREFLYLARRDASPEVRMGSLDGREPVLVTESECQAEFAAGTLFTVREGVLFATACDPSTGKIEGGSTPLVEQILITSRDAAAGSYSVLPSGRLLFQTGSSETERVLSWGDLETKASVPIGSPGQLYAPRISPDGRLCAIEIQGESELGTDIWLVDLETGQRNRFTFEVGDEVAPCWTPDGSTIVYTSRADGMYRIMTRPVEGTGGASTLYESTDTVTASSVHPDGDRILLTRDLPDTSTAWNLEVLEHEGDGTPTVILPGEGYGGRYSPDGRWIAYGGITAGVWQVFVMPADGGSRKWQVTGGGAIWPQWQPDGRRLFAQGYGKKVVALDVDPTGESFRFGSSQELMESEVLTPRGSPFSVHPDGRRIVQAWREPNGLRDEISPIHLVTDWRRMLVR
ncbi:MAG TPA: hypothetical protein VKU85_15715, partial [bacterium]|nr:hypothetical protein [bacterium]